MAPQRPGSSSPPRQHQAKCSSSSPKPQVGKPRGLSPGSGAGTLWHSWRPRPRTLGCQTRGCDTRPGLQPQETPHPETPPKRQRSLTRQATGAALTFLNWFARFRLYLLSRFNVHVTFLAPKEGWGGVPQDENQGSKQPAGATALRHHLVITSLFTHANFINIIYIFKAIYK